MGRVSPATLHREISADLPGKERHGKKGKVEKNGEEKKENRKRDDGKWEWKEEKLQNEKRGLSFFFLLFIKTTEISFGSTKWEFSTEKKRKKENHFTPGKKSRETTSPYEKYSSYTLALRNMVM